MTIQKTRILIRRAEVFVFRVAVEHPVRTSFGVMTERAAVLLRIEDDDGAYGWGEAWCNFPTCGAEHRAHLLETVIIPLLLEKEYAAPAELFESLTKKTSILALQSGEFGPLAQVVAAADIAAWDLCARKAGLPLHRFLGGSGDGSMPAYASGINPTGVTEAIDRSRQSGYRAFKFKIGFGLERDLENLRAALQVLQPGERLAVDANQAWDLPTALKTVESMDGKNLMWLEEPLRCDTHLSQWIILRDHCPVPLAGGENIRGKHAFQEAIQSRALGVLQPDVCKWGGITHCQSVAQSVLDAGLRYCPHYLGGGIGLLASAHILASVGGDGLLEVDINPNPLRELLAQPHPAIREGRFCLNDKTGLGAEPDLTLLSELITFHVELH